MNSDTDINNSEESILTAAERTEIDHEISHAPYRSAVAIDALKIVQKHHRWVSDQRLKALAEYLDMSAAELDGIATFYNLIYRKPVGEKVISLCDSVSCWIMGYNRLQNHISQKLDVSLGGTTDDDKYTFLPAPCLGACDRAPVMMLGEELHQDLDEAKLDKIFDATDTKKDEGVE
jgi:NADH-quinone oxidoreductase subunit E